MPSSPTSVSDAEPAAESDVQADRFRRMEEALDVRETAQPGTAGGLSFFFSHL
ncbi:hypothetical protein [Streptomyces sp. NRRL F-5053]|uniref:hypothetical protein n=1 Tax=Streptomyces sp. NRRL F-5053 TaxID=1463854 RepID=UPI000B132D85|nr:hypothetical protein [Streptomyces sp. NRRL F-5053]